MFCGALVCISGIFVNWQVATLAVLIKCLRFGFFPLLLYVVYKNINFIERLPVFVCVRARPCVYAYVFAVCVCRVYVCVSF